MMLVMITILGPMVYPSILGQRNQCSSCPRRCQTGEYEQIHHDNLYVHGGFRPLNSILEDIEHRLEKCAMPDCDPDMLRYKYYHEIPPHIHSEYIDNLKINMVEEKVNVIQKLKRPYPKAIFIAYPNKNTFKNDPSIYNNALNPSEASTFKFTFDPDTIDFGVRPIGLIADTTFQMKNYGSNIRIDFFMFDTPQFLLFHSPENYFLVNEGRSFKFNLRFIPARYGNITANLFLRIAPGVFLVYKISGFGTENIFEVRPVMMHMPILGKRYTFPVKILNPFPNKPLIIQNISSLDENVTLFHADSSKRYQSGSQIVIPPLHEKTFIKILYIPKIFSDTTKKLVIKANGIEIVIPMRIIIVPRDILFTPAKLDFGTVSLPSMPLLLKVKIKSLKDMVIVEMVPPKNPNFVCNFPQFKKSSVRLSAGVGLEGYIGFYAGSVGKQSGNIIIRTQSMQYNIELQAEVVRDIFTTTLEDTIGVYLINCRNCRNCRNYIFFL